MFPSEETGDTESKALGLGLMCSRLLLGVWVTDVDLAFFCYGWLVLWWVGVTLEVGERVDFFLSGVGGGSGLRGMVQ